MKCKIITIYDRATGKERTDGRYPLRKGCTLNFVLRPQIGDPMVWDYISDAKGMPKEGRLSTSAVAQILDTDKGLTVTTRNSIYVFEKL